MPSHLILVIEILSFGEAKIILSFPKKAVPKSDNFVLIPTPLIVYSPGEVWPKRYAAVRKTVSVSNLKNASVNDVALTQIFPSGWEIINTRFTAFGSTTTSAARHTDIRDDRVNFYFDLPEKGKHSTKTFNVMLNASYLGTYYLPGVQAEAMYDNEFLVRTKGKWVVIEK